MPRGKVLLKISGEALGGRGSQYSAGAMDFIHGEVLSLINAGQIPCIVVGGGNIYRGRTEFFDRVTGDRIGMLATVMNALALADYLNSKGISAKAYSSIEMPRIAALFNKEQVLNDISSGIIPVFGGGTANPFFSTDTLVALRAAELGIGIILKGSTVDGIYDKDPKKNKNAVKYKKIAFNADIDLDVILDQSAFFLAKQNRTEIVVYDFFKKGNTLKALNKKTGTYIYWGK